MRPLKESLPLRLQLHHVPSRAGRQRPPASPVPAQPRLRTPLQALRLLQRVQPRVKHPATRASYSARMHHRHQAQAQLQPTNARTCAKAQPHGAPSRCSSTGSHAPLTLGETRPQKNNRFSTAALLLGSNKATHRNTLPCLSPAGRALLCTAHTRAPARGDGERCSSCGGLRVSGAGGQHRQRRKQGG